MTMTSTPPGSEDTGSPNHKWECVASGNWWSEYRCRVCSATFVEEPDGAAQITDGPCGEPVSPDVAALAQRLRDCVPGRMCALAREAADALTTSESARLDAVRERDEAYAALMPFARIEEVMEPGNDGDKVYASSLELEGGGEEFELSGSEVKDDGTPVLHACSSWPRVPASYVAQVSLGDFRTAHRVIYKQGGYSRLDELIGPWKRRAERAEARIAEVEAALTDLRRVIGVVIQEVGAWGCDGPNGPTDIEGLISAELNRPAAPPLPARAAMGEREMTPTTAEENPMDAAEIKRLVDRFLAWPLPKSVRSDLCVTMDYPHERRGTSLLTADEARQMIEYLFAASPSHAREPPVA